MLHYLIFSLVGLLASCTWLLQRTQRLRGELAHFHYISQVHLQQLAYVTDSIKQETGFPDADALIRAWRNLCYRLGYALHHFEQFEPTPLLKSQLAFLGSRLLGQAQGFGNGIHQDHGGVRKGGFREVGGTGYQIEDDMHLLLDGLTIGQVAKLSCLLLDGCHLERAFSHIGIAVLSPIGKAIAQGKLSVNSYVACAEQR